jgi:hypothetical protein
MVAPMAAYTNEELYAPCPCGSGKKLKFCCKDGLLRRPPPSEARELELAIEEASADNVVAARARLEKLVAANSKEVLVHGVLATLLAAAGEEDAAIVRARRTLELVPGHLPAIGLLAHLLAVRGARDEANALLDRVLRAPIKDRLDANSVVMALAVLERDADVVAVVSALSGPITHLLAFAQATAAINLGDITTAIRVLMASLQERFDDFGAVLLQVASGQTKHPWPRLGVLAPGYWIPHERTLFELSALETATAPHADVQRSEILAQALRLLTLTSLGTEEERAVGTVIDTMSRLAPSVARRELQLVANSELGSAEARHRFATALAALGDAPAVVEAAPAVVEAAPAVINTPSVEAAPAVVVEADAPIANVPVAQMGLFGEVLATKAAKAELSSKKAALRAVDKEAPAAAFYEGCSIAELRRFLDAFGVEHTGIKKKSELLALMAHAVEDGDLVVDIVNELREHEDLYDVTDALIDAGGLVELEEMQRRFGVPKPGDELSDLEMLLANGLAVQAIVDGKASVVLPTPIRSVLCDALREEA